MMTLDLLALPHELLERILLLLPNESVQTCRLVNRALNEIIQSSTLLQYLQACQVAGVIDNPRSPLSYAERLEALKKREDAWRKLKPVFEMTISVKQQIASTRICRSIEGIFFLTDDIGEDLNYCHLTSFSQDNPRWTRIPRHGPVLDWSGILVNFTAALYEHDLIVNFISSDIENQADILQRHSLDLVLLKFSTGECHPLARRPRIHVQTSPEVKPWIFSRIVGDNLALVVHSYDGTFSDKLLIFDWKTGRKLLQHDASKDAYLSFVFISPELLLVPNRVLSHFEVWNLPPRQLDPKPPIQILSLQLPAVSPEYSIFEFGCSTCYGVPSPILPSMRYFPPRPFFSSPKDSIVVVTLRPHRGASYNLIMHRRTLLDTIQTWTSLSLLEQQEDLPAWLTNEVTVHQIADPEDGSVQLDVESTLVSTIPHPRSSPQTHEFPVTFAASQTLPTSHISTNFGSSSVSFATSSMSRCPFLQVPWAKWGPPISRWFQINDTQAQWPLVSNGQRCAFSEPNLLDRTKLMISVADFNQHNFRRNAEMMAQLGSKEGENNENNSNKAKEKEDFEKLDDWQGLFSEEVYMGLKCVVYHAPDQYNFDLVLMDEERMFGVKLNHHGWNESIKVLYIG